MSSSDSIESILCRACMKESSASKSIYKQGLILGELTTLGTLLTYLTNIDFLPEEDFLPGEICVPCIQVLAKACIFKRTVMESNEVLRKHYELDGKIFEIIETEGEVEQAVGSDEEGTTHLEELATAAQLKQALDMGSEWTVTVLQESIDDENAESQHTVIQYEASEDVVVHEIAETSEVYQEEIIESEEMDLKEEEDCENFETESVEIDQDEIEVNVEEYGRETEMEVVYPTKLEKARKRAHANDEKSEEPKAKRVPKPRVKSTEPKKPNPDLQCSVCGKQLSNLNSFKYHMQLHSDETPYLCSLCGEGFKTRNAYEGHIIIHDPNNPNTCVICGKSYRQASSLRTHMLSHTGEKPFQCDICGKGITQKSGYKKHMLTHTGEKPHNCDVCGRDFRYSSNLIAHKRCHSGEKPYECPHCEKTFPTSEQMKRHTLVHTGDRPFPCELCGKSFKRRISLAAHLSTHPTQTVQYDEKVSKSNVVELY